MTFIAFALGFAAGATFVAYVVPTLQGWVSFNL